MKNYIFVALLLLAVAMCDKGKLRFNPDGSFKVIQVSDLHYGEDINRDHNSTQVMRTLIEAENPDFLAFSGDMVSGYAWDKTEGWYKRMWDRWTEIINEKQIPYGYTLGNHDGEADLKRREVIEVDMQNPYSYTQLCSEEIPGASTYVVPVYSSKDENQVVFNIWFFDSNAYDCLGVKGYGCVSHETVDWYYETSRRLEKEQGGKKPGIAFMHIPPPEWMYAWNHFDSVGIKEQLVKCQSVNTGLMGAFIERGEIISVFTGHDHLNDFSVQFDKMLVGYTRTTGYSSYGPPSGKLHGGRVFKFTEDEFSMKTYIIQEDGTIDEQEPQPDKGTKQDMCDRMAPPHSIHEEL